MRCEKFLDKVSDKTNVNYSMHKQRDNSYVIEMEYWSSLGEDVVITLVIDELTKDSIREEMWNYYEGFDPEEHAAVWFNMHGKHGAPTSLRALLDDADKQDSKLKEIYDVMCTL